MCQALNGQLPTLTNCAPTCGPLCRIKKRTPLQTGWTERLKTFSTFHATADFSLNGRPISLRQISSILQKVDLIFVHSKEGQRRLGEMGVSDNVRVIHHGNIGFPEENRAIRSELGIKFQPVIG